MSTRQKLTLVLLVLSLPLFSVRLSKAQATLSPYIVASVNEGSNYDICSYDTSGALIARLTNTTWNNWWPKISPNGSMIAFTSNQSGQYDVYVMNKDGSNVSRVTTTGTYGGANTMGFVRWMDDSTLFYTHGSTIHKIKVDGTGDVQIIASADGGGIHNFDYDPLIGEIIYQSQGSWGYTNNFYMVDTNGTGSQLVLANRTGLEHYPEFTPDGKSFVYLFDISGHEESSGRSLNDHLFVHNIATGSEVDISTGKPDGYDDMIGVFSEDGRTVYFTSQINDGSQPPSIIKASSTGADRTTLVADAGYQDLWPRFSPTPTAIGQVTPRTPANYSLYQNYPNPFNPTTQINFSVPKNSFVTLKVYNVLGQEVATLFSGMQKAGKYVATFDANRFASGVYFYRLQAGSFSSVKKMMLMK